MISAEEVGRLYQEPPYTNEEVEAQILHDAKTSEFSVFKALRLTYTTITLLRESGYKVEGPAGGDIVVRWRQIPAQSGEAQHTGREA